MKRLSLPLEAAHGPIPPQSPYITLKHADILAKTLRFENNPPIQGALVTGHKNIGGD